MIPEIYQPSKELSEFVMCYWTLVGDKDTTPVKNTIVPDGTMKLIFHYGDTYKHHPKLGESILLPKCFLIGQLTRPFVVEPVGITGTFVVRFHPNGFEPFSTIPLTEIQNTAVPLDKLFGDIGYLLAESILKAKSVSERISIIETFLIERLKDKNTLDSFVQSTVKTILSTKGRFIINEFSQDNNINRKQINRKFSSNIGLGPKQLSKTIRIQSTLKGLLIKKFDKLTDLAYENEYFDQAHFIKDFKAFTGITPKEFYGEQLKMSLIFEGKD